MPRDGYAGSRIAGLLLNGARRYGASGRIACFSRVAVLPNQLNNTVKRGRDWKRVRIPLGVRASVTVSRPVGTGRPGVASTIQSGPPI
jgi:hypothetical protein